MTDRQRVLALAGGVGAARFLRGLVEVVDPADLTVVVNTGDDREFYGVHVCPDLDIVTYTLSDAVNPELGYGLAGDTFHVVDQLAARGEEAWFRLGDRDFANCLHRTLALRAGDGLVETADALRRAQGLDLRILPMSEDPCPTLVDLVDGRKMHFEEYLIRERSPEGVAGVDLTAAEKARPARGVVEAIGEADVVLVCPSNPVVSIGPILALPGVREALLASAAPIVAVSPIIGGAPVKGPADRLLRGIGVEVSARGVARHYADLIDGFVLDRVDADQADDVRALGLAACVTETLMSTRTIAAELARSALALASESVSEST